MIYLHPWEVDPGQPKPRVSRLKLWRHRVGMSSVLGKLERLLGEFSFGPVRDVLNPDTNHAYAENLKRDNVQLSGSAEPASSPGPIAL